MSCTRRRTQYRWSVVADSAGGQHSAEHHALHLPARPMIAVGPDLRIARTPVSPGGWHTLMAMVQMLPTTDQAHIVHEMFTHVNESNERSRLPPLTDADVASLWTTMLTTIPPGGDLSSFWETPQASVLRDMVFTLVTQASDRMRLWMWESFQTAHSLHGGPFPAVVRSALDWRIPLWSLPNGITNIAHALQNTPSSAMAALEDALRFWSSSDDWAIRSGMQSLLSEVLALHVPGDPTMRAMWLGAVEVVLRNNPSGFETVREVADAVFAACIDDQFEISDPAWDILTIVRPFTHPRFRPTVEQVLQTSDYRHITEQAVDLLLTDLCRMLDLEAIHRLVDDAWQTVIDPDRALLPSHVATDVLKRVISCSICAPVIRPYLRSLRMSAQIPRSILMALFVEPQPSYAAVLADEMIAIAMSVIGTPNHAFAFRILRRSWGKGGDAQIMEGVLRHSQSFQAVELTSILASGLYHPQHGKQVVDLITHRYPTKAAQYLVHGIGQGYREGQQLAPEVLSSVVRMYADAPSAWSTNALRAVWDTDPHVALDIVKHLVETLHPIPETTIRSLGYGWGRGFDDHIATIVTQIMQHDDVLSLASPVRAITTAICDGIGTVSPDVILSPWYYLIRSVPPHHRDTVVACMVPYVIRHPEIWTDTHLSMTISMLRACKDPQSFPIVGNITPMRGDGLEHDRSWNGAAAFQSLLNIITA